MVMREDDDTNNGRTYFRASDRVFRVDDGWFYATREGDMGPHPSRDAAALDLKRYLSEKRASGNVDGYEIAEPEELNVVDINIWKSRPDTLID